MHSSYNVTSTLGVVFLVPVDFSNAATLTDLNIRNVFMCCVSQVKEIGL